MDKFTGTPALLFCILLICALFYVLDKPVAPPAPPIAFENHTEAAGLVRYSPTFAAVVTDLDNDGRDDLFVGHHGYPPAFYLNRDGRFTEQPDLNPLPHRQDRHGYTFVDIDNDGDRDFIYAGGGADGIGPGSGNRVFQSVLAQTGAPGFVDVTDASDIAYPTYRSRVFYPMASADGARVDLYLTAIHRQRDESSNLYVVNESTPGNVKLRANPGSAFNERIDSDGMDLVFDYDRDGLPDFLSVARGQVRLYRNTGERFAHVESELDDLRRVRSAAAADFNNDGYLDLYIGANSGHSGADNVSHNRDELHFVITRQDGDTEDALRFKTSSSELRFDFAQHLPEEGRGRTDASDIFLGRDGRNPPSRRGKLRRNASTGKPAAMGAPGTYLWRDPETDAYHVVWRHDEAVLATSKGIIYGADIELLGTSGMEEIPMREVRDQVLVNRQGRGWRRYSPDSLKHREWTNSVTAADFNNDGLIDIAGVRTRDEGKPNGEPFLVANRGDLQFSFERIMQNEADDIFRADAIVHGFFDDDGLPDLFFTNGFGLMPGHVGPYQLWLNRSPQPGGHALLRLEGTRANRDAIGAQVELLDADGELLGYREIGPGFGRGQDTLQLHFGLGDYAGPLQARVRWPGGERPQDYALPGAGRHVLRER